MIAANPRWQQREFCRQWRQNRLQWQQRSASDHKIVSSGNGGRLVAVVRTAVAVDDGGTAKSRNVGHPWSATFLVDRKMLSVAAPQRRPYIGAYSGHIHRGHTAVGDMLEAGEPLEGGGWVTGSEFYEAELSPSAPPSICKAERLLQRVYTRRAARGARQVAGLALLVTIGCPRSACVHCLPQRQCPAGSRDPSSTRTEGGQALEHHGNATLTALHRGVGLAHVGLLEKRAKVSRGLVSESLGRPASVSASTPRRPVHDSAW